MKSAFPNFKKDVDQIKVPEEKMDLVVERAINQGKKNKQWSLSKKISYSSVAVVLLFSLFIGSAFVFPTMAHVAAKVPYLNLIFNIEPASGAIFDDLKERGYKIKGTSFRVRNKTMTVSIGGSEKYFNDVEDEVGNVVEDILQSRHYDAYKLEIVHDKAVKHKESLSEEQKSKIMKYRTQSKNFEEAIMKELKQRDFGILSAHVRINSREKFVPLEILASEKRVEEMKRIVQNIAKEKNLKEVSIKVYRIDPKKEKAEERWMPVINTIFDGLLAKKEYKVTGAGYSFYPAPLKIEIRTSIQSSKPEAEELGKKIENTIDKFIESKEIEANVKDDPYRVVVLSKDKKKIN